MLIVPCMDNVQLLAHVQWNKCLFTPMLFVLLGCKSQFAQECFWALDNHYLSHKLSSRSLAGALPVTVAFSLLRPCTRTICGEDQTGTSSDKHFLAAIYFGEQDSLLHGSLPLGSMLSWAQLGQTLPSDYYFQTLTPVRGEYLSLTSEEHLLSEPYGHNLFILFLILLEDGTSRDHLIHPPAKSQATDQVYQSTVQPRNISSKGDSTTSLGCLYQCLILLRTIFFSP